MDEPAAADDGDDDSEENYDLENQEDFNKALKSKIQMPFLFGPVEFTGLHQSEEEEKFNFESEREKVISILQRSSLLP